MNLMLARNDEGSPEMMIAKTALRPTVRAAATLCEFNNLLGELDLTATVEKLADQVNAVNAGDLRRSEEMLVAQSHTLDLLFHQLLARSIKNSHAGYLDASETYMRLALRAQSQCRATLETLSVVKNPPSVAFVRQANIAHGLQQINNGQLDLPRARENPQIRVLETPGNERMDAGAPKAPIGGDSEMEAVGKVHRAANP